MYHIATVDMLHSYSVSYTERVPEASDAEKNNCQATAFIKYFSKTLLTLSPPINLFSVDNCLSCQLSFAKKDYDIGFRVTPILE